MKSEEISLGAKLAQNASVRPNHLAVTCGGESLTYAQLHRRSNRLAHGLAGLGVKQGDLVSIGLPNSVAFVEVCQAIWKLGATPQPVSFRLPAAELSAILSLAKSRLFIGDAEGAGALATSLKDIEAAGGGDSDLPDATPPVAKAPTSGGSTGRPKLILSGNPGVAPKATPEVGDFLLKPGSVALLPGPLYHNAPFSMMMKAIAYGAHVVLLPRFDAEAALAAIDRHRVTWTCLVPTMMSRMWRLSPEVRDAYDISSLEMVWHLAAPCAGWLKEAFIGWIAPGTLMEFYGGTEAIAATVISGEQWLSHRGSVGRVSTGEMKIVDEAGRDLPSGVVGEIYMRAGVGAAPTYRYIGAEAKTLDGGWQTLGDLGWFDEQGFLFLADRRSDLILVGGANVYPAEVEAFLEEHPDVQSCAVIGLPDEDLGARVHAIIQPRGEVTELALKAHLAERLVSYKLPRTYEFVDASLRDEAGKVRRGALRDARIAAGV